jgi:hypothetical protein
MSTNIPEGFGIIAGRSRVNAQAALDAADTAGVARSQVKAVPEGYLVPDAVLDAWHEAAVAEPADVTYVDGTKPEVGDDGIPIVHELTPTSDWKNAEIKDWAATHEIDLGDATTKADMLAAIAAANEKE